MILFNHYIVKANKLNNSIMMFIALLYSELNSLWEQSKLGPIFFSSYFFFFNIWYVNMETVALCTKQSKLLQMPMICDFSLVLIQQHFIWHFKIFLNRVIVLSHPCFVLIKTRVWDCWTLLYKSFSWVSGKIRTQLRQKVFYILVGNVFISL